MICETKTFKIRRVIKSMHLYKMKITYIILLGLVVFASCKKAKDPEPFTPTMTPIAAKYYWQALVNEKEKTYQDNTNGYVNNIYIEGTNHSSVFAKYSFNEDGKVFHPDSLATIFRLGTEEVSPLLLTGSKSFSASGEQSGVAIVYVDAEGKEWKTEGGDQSNSSFVIESFGYDWEDGWPVVFYVADFSYTLYHGQESIKVRNGKVKALRPY
jgi:hypothetical protein